MILAIFIFTTLSWKNSIEANLFSQFQIYQFSHCFFACLFVCLSGFFFLLYLLFHLYRHQNERTQGLRFTIDLWNTPYLFVMVSDRVFIPSPCISCRLHCAIRLLENWSASALPMGSGRTQREYIWRGEQLCDMNAICCQSRALELFSGFYQVQEKSAISKTCILWKSGLSIYNWWIIVSTFNKNGVILEVFFVFHHFISY